MKRDGLTRKAMRSWQEQEPATRPNKRRAKRGALVRHPVFVPALAAWGAALGGLSLAILPGSMIASITMTTGLSSLGDFARIVLCVVAATILGLIALGIALAIRKSYAPSEPDAASFVMSMRRVNPIDPASELGSESLDAPIETAPFNNEAPESSIPGQEVDVDDALDLAFENEVAGAQEELKAPARNGAFDPLARLRNRALDAVEASNDETLEQEDIALDLGDFLDGQGDDAQPVDAEPIESPVTDSEAMEHSAEIALGDVSSPGPEPASAIDRLRQAQPDDLSLVQMVERFAAALHEHQAAARRRAAAGLAPPPTPGRDAALAEALKALALFTDRGFDAQNKGTAHSSPQHETVIGDTESELRNALNKLQELRGAA